MQMKKIIYIIISCLLISCELEVLDKGDIDGHWQLRQIDTLATGGTCDMSYSNIYWAVESNILQVRYIDNSNLKILFRYEKQGDELMIHTPFHVITKDELEPVEDAELLTPFGIIGTKDSFHIEKLSHSNLVMKNENYQLYFRRY